MSSFKHNNNWCGCRVEDLCRKEESLLFHLVQLIFIHNLGSVLQICFHSKPQGYEATTLGSIDQL